VILLSHYRGFYSRSALFLHHNAFNRTLFVLLQSSTSSSLAITRVVHFQTAKRRDCSRPLLPKMHVEIQAAIVLLLAAHSSAIDTVSIAQTVQAGTDVPVSITTDFGQGRYSVDAQWEHYRLYLSEDKVHYKLTPMCKHSARFCVHSLIRYRLPQSYPRLEHNKHHRKHST
jgi:hypothetical protein